ncbi:unnamed protein product [Acanthoscelides obtectus]|uniref:Uncharacterized protein n=1 Tax=Acanthoscelides obtectus TaxID=200917 RepID=A0A9P0L6T9_ACAOB|nr:unnamed protein product [Acanthoscelides obtectus]CAK1620882.1 hypothetical protein AOBTE_LOCUS633 [Acanthoscelides obtectus]
MKFVILLSLVAFCYAVPFPMKSIDFTEDGKIVITEPTGKRVTIYKSLGPAGGRTFQIQVEGPNFPTKSVQIDEDPHKTMGVHKDISLGRKGLDIIIDNPYFPKAIHVDKNHLHDHTHYDHVHHGHEYDHHHDHHFDHNKVYSAGKGSTAVHEVEKRASKLPTKPLSQSELLDELLKEFQGAVTDKEYEKLLSKVYKFVKTGDLDPVVYEMLFEMSVTPVSPVDKKQPNTSEVSPSSPIYPIYRDWINYKMSLVNDKIASKNPYETPMFGYKQPGYDQAYNRPVYGYDRPVYGYERPTYGYSGVQSAYSGVHPASGYSGAHPTYGYSGVQPAPTYGYPGMYPVGRVPYQAPYHYGPYSQDYQRTGYEGVAPHPTYYNRPATTTY